jgi:hypothetical protein
MQDLSTIQRNNHEAVQQAAAAAEREGKLVLFKYSGLNFVDYSLHETEAERNAASIEWNNASPGNRSGFSEEV